MWKVMSDMFGELWTNKRGVIPDNSDYWVVTLSQLTDKQIKTGCDLVENSGKEFPPKLPAFKEMCLTRSLDDYLADIAREDRERAAALPKPTDKAKAKEFIKAGIKQARDAKRKIYGET